MGSRNRNTLLLVVIFAVLFSYYWFVQKNKPTPVAPEEKQPEAIVLTSYDTSKIREVSWKYASASAKVRKDNDTWKFSEPAVVGDANKISDYVQTVAHLNGELKYSTAEVSLNDAGINSPSLTLTVSLDGGQTDTIQFGKQTLDNTYYYAHKNNDEQVVLVPVYTVDELKKNPYLMYPAASPSSSPVASGQP